MPVYDCGCINEVDPASGVLRSVSKCRAHRWGQRDPATLGRDYYAAFGLLDGDLLVPTAHVAELTEALGPFPPARGRGLALEVGCGVSPYAGAIQAAGWIYLGLDASPWAAGWTAEHWDVETIAADFEAWAPSTSYGLVLAAHVLEHVHDAPAVVGKLAGLLEPGGELWVVVPDDSDPFNPDHLWYFTEASLRACLESAGLVVEAMAIRRHVAHENFIYCRARKPG